MSALLVGEVSVASSGALLGIFEIWLGTLRRSSEYIWAGAACLGTGTYAALMYVQYQARSVELGVLTQQLAGVALALIGWSVFEYGASRRRRVPARVLWAVRGATVLVAMPLATTHWVVSSQASWIQLATLDHLVPEPRVALPLGAVFLAYALALATVGASMVVAQRRSPLLMGGIGLWVITASHDLLHMLGVIGDRFYVMEYGFLGFAVALVSQHAAEYTVLLRESERARDALAEENRRVEELSHTVVQRVDDGIAFIDTDGRLRIYNPTMARITGHSAEQSLGRHYVGVLPEPQGGAALEETMERVLATRSAATLEVLSADGRAALLTLVPSGDDTRLHGCIVVLRDVSRQRELTQRMMEMDRMITAGTMAAGVGHEINNPLSYVITNVEFARERLAEAEDPLHAELAEVLGEATEGARRIRDVVLQLRAMVRPEEHRHPISVPVARILDWTVKMTEGETRTRAVVARDYDASCRVVGVESQLGQVFLNLVLNAAQAIEPGAEADNCIRLSAWRVGERVRIEVEDTGPGIPVEYAERIFEPFFTTKGPAQGTGLGLAISRRIVQQHGGVIHVDSTPGRGTRFVVELPAAESVKSSRPPIGQLDASARLRLLLVDDDDLVARGLARSLRRMHNVEVCRSGSEALELLSQDRRFDLVLSDIMMGDMNGIELFERIAVDDPELASRAVLMTGAILTEQAQRFQREYPDRVVQKPLEKADIATLIARFAVGDHSRAAASTRSDGCAART